MCVCACVRVLTEYFNELFTAGDYPDLCAQAIVVSIHEKGTLTCQIIIEVTRC